MFLLNLSLAEFLALAGTLSGFVVALYLLDRSRRRQVVSSLRFWVESRQPARSHRRRRIQQPWSLALQVASIILLLLALADLRWGSPDRSSRDHVLLLDTSAWMAARTPRGGLMEEARAASRAWLRSLGALDRVMVVHADALSTPVTGFESSRQVVLDAINRSEPSSSALNIEQALAFARQALRLTATRPGEIALAGAARIARPDPASAREAGPGLRFLPVSETVENCGLRKIGLRRSPSDAALWEILVTVRNYGRRPREVPVALEFGGAPVGLRRLRLDPDEERHVSFTYRTRAAGWLQARLLTPDALPEDDRATVELPAQRTLRVAVYSERPEALRAVLVANPNVEAVFRSPSAYRPDPDAALVILDRFRPPALPAVGTVWIEPPQDGSPIPVQTVARDAPLLHWRPDHPLGAGLRTADLRPDAAEVFRPSPGDVPVAECAAGPVILARPGKPKLVALGFNPFRTAMRFELATPLLFANILRWMAPEVFLRWELSAGGVGAVSVPLEPDDDAGAIRIAADNRQPVPFTLQGRSLRFFMAAPGVVRARVGDREMVYSLTLPEVAESRWEPPRDASRGLPRPVSGFSPSRGLWPLLALLGAACFIAEWVLYGRRQPLGRAASSMPASVWPFRKAS